ncbi:hypothetical protein VTI28DRAFT_8629 [Corynascus sepedonium]
MPTKRLSPSSDASDIVEMPLKKTHRTHEENQERAYIAASRRADRDIEHRIRSALKASECRRKRTGRGLKITREAVMGDEQYESEDDDHASRRFSMPATTTTSLSNPYMSSPSSAADRYAEVDALFAKHFPHVQLSSHWSRQQQPSHRHSYPQTSLSLHAHTQPGGYVPRFQQQQQQQQQLHQHHHSQHQDTPVPLSMPAQPSTTHSAAASMTAASSSCSSSPALLTPPVSYPLPPATFNEESGSSNAKSGSVSPLALENQRPPSSLLSRPGSTTSAAAQQATVGLGIASGYFEVDDNTASSATPIGVDYSATAAATAGTDPVWFGDHTPVTTAGGGGGWHSRSLSLPSALEHFQFFPTLEPASIGEESSDALIDPGILASASTSVSVDGVDVGAPSEPWADWVNLDGDVPAPLGVEV